MKGETKNKIALFASGNGTNVQRICEYFRGTDNIRPEVLFCNRADAFVLQRAQKLGLPSVVINRRQLTDPAFMRPLLRQYGVTHLVLAGFLALIPPFLIEDFPDRILNIHPALLPKFGGKGMYGHHVHTAVVAAGEKTSGITVHLVNGDYDSGKIIFQAECTVDNEDNADILAEKIHALEQTYFAPVIERWIKGETCISIQNKPTKP